MLHYTKISNMATVMKGQSVLDGHSYERPTHLIRPQWWEIILSYKATFMGGQSVSSGNAVFTQVWYFEDNSFMKVSLYFALMMCKIWTTPEYRGTEASVWSLQFLLWWFLQCLCWWSHRSWPSWLECCWFAVSTITVHNQYRNEMDTVWQCNWLKYSTTFYNI